MIRCKRITQKDIADVVDHCESMILTALNNQRMGIARMDELHNVALVLQMVGKLVPVDAELTEATVVDAVAANRKLKAARG